MRVLFRCDSSKTAGVGHVARVSALIAAVNAAGGETAVVGNINTVIAARILSAAGAGEINSDALAVPELSQFAAQWGADVVHLDSYSEMNNLRESLNETGVLLSSIEDGTFGRRNADIVIDVSPGSERKYREPAGLRSHLRGVEYFPLRQEVLKHRGRGEVAPTVRRVMVALGGTDSADLTHELAELWAKTGVKSECYLLGVAIPPELILRFDHVRWFSLDRAPDIAGTFAQMDLVVCASGTALWELAYLGIPMATLQIIDNQAEYFRFSSERGIGLPLGDISEGARHEVVLSRAVPALRSFASSRAQRAASTKAGQTLVDGGGAERIVGEWQRLVHAKKVDVVQVRAARAGDASDLYAWRTDALAVEMSRTSGEISWEAHVDWLERSLADSSRHLLLVEDPEGLVGTVRFDEIAVREWEVSITLAPDRRGQGLAVPVLHASEEWLLKEVGIGVTLRADFRAVNVASQNVFRRAGYEMLVDDQGSPGWRTSRKFL